MFNSQPKGFTLIEMVITIVVVSILAGLAGMVILEGVRAYTVEQTRSDVHYQARLAMERMAREIRMIRSQADISAMAAANLRYTDANGSNTGFNWVNPTLNRWNGAGNDVLATGITAFTLSYFQQDGVTAATTANVWFVEISMTAEQGAESLVLSSRVHPRNF
jgi:prepilin-type N-terminal cleavage/methylation domain-containing protein